MTVAQAIAACSRITRRHSSTFYLGSAFFRGDRRRAVTAVYAACRLGDDAVDAAPGPAEAEDRLLAWWEGVERAFAGSPRPEVAFEVALAWAVRRFGIPKEAFAELCSGPAVRHRDGRRRDARRADALLPSGRRRGRPDGRADRRVPRRSGDARPLRRRPGPGDAAHQRAAGRRRGPRGWAAATCRRELRRRHGVELDDLRRGAVTPGYVALRARSRIAHALYREGWRGIPRLRGVARLAVGVAALNYEAIVHKLRQNRYDNLTRRAHLRPLERLALIPRALSGRGLRSARLILRRATDAREDGPCLTTR
jgi:15-cis-phytoene synthase